MRCAAKTSRNSRIIVISVPFPRPPFISVQYGISRDPSVVRWCSLRSPKLPCTHLHGFPHSSIYRNATSRVGTECWELSYLRDHIRRHLQNKLVADLHAISKQALKVFHLVAIKISRFYMRVQTVLARFLYYI